MPEDQTTVVTKQEVTSTQTDKGGTLGIITPAEPESKILDVSIRGWMAIMLVLTICLLAGLGIEIKEPLYSISIMAVSFYYGQKTGNKNQ